MDTSLEETQIAVDSLRTSQFDQILGCMDIQTPYTVLLADGSEIFMEKGFNRLAKMFTEELPGQHPVGFLYPLNIQLANGTQETITSNSQLESLLEYCRNQK